MNPAVGRKHVRGKTWLTTRCVGFPCLTLRAALPFSNERQAITTWAPLATSSDVVANPIPALAPVTMHTYNEVQAVGEPQEKTSSIFS